MGGPDEKGPTAEELRLIERGNEKASFATGMEFGRDYLDASSDVDRSRRYEEQHRAGQIGTITNAVNSQDPTGVMVPLDTRPFAGSSSAAMAQSDTENSETKAGLIGTSLGRQVQQTAADYNQAQRDANLYYADKAASDANAAIIPSVIGTGAGIAATGGFDDAADKWARTKKTVTQYV